MREIKFRGFNGEKWLFGNLDIDYKTKHACISDNRFWRHPVRFDTVGQYTGLKDWAGQEIYEGDIVTFGRGTEPSEVRWDNEYAYFVIMKSLLLGHACKAVHVIGNVHDNPELMEGKDA